MLRRTLVALVAAALTLLVCEGLLSWSGRSLLPDGPGGVDPSVLKRLREAAKSQGLYAVHPDPQVGYVLARDRDDLAIHEGRIRSDALGLRRRAGPEPAGDVEPFRVAVVGDSVAFGYGLDDDETLAHQLEQVLNDVRGPGAAPIVARTVAMPGWNARNAVRFTLDHLQELDPDLVIYMPVGNDLYDTDGVLETGHRRVGVDPASADPWLDVHSGAMRDFRRGLEKRSDVALADPGAPLMAADISRESRRRYTENVSALTRLRDRLAQDGVPLLLAVYRDGTYTATLMARLERLSEDWHACSLLLRLPAEHTLGFDPHPNAETVGVLANWVAASLLERGLVDPGEGRALPEVPETWDALRAEAYRHGRYMALARSLRENSRRALRPRVDLRTGEGTSQVYGGLHQDGSAGPVFKAGLRRDGRQLLVHVMGLRDGPELQVEVFADGVWLGALEVRPGEVTKRLLDLDPVDVEGPGEAGGQVLEVELRPTTWSVGVTTGGRRFPRSMYPLLLATDGEG